MIKFPKTDGLYRRDPDTHQVTTEHRHPIYEQIKSWWVEEKVDGTNCRIILHPGEPERCDVRGRSDAADLSKPLREALERTAFRAHQTEEWAALHEAAAESGKHVCLYGEGVGPGINGNPHKLGACAFVLFDVKFGDDAERGWAPPAEVQRIAQALGICPVPVMAESRELWDAEERVRLGFPSILSQWLGAPQPTPDAEGVVLKVRWPLYDARGRLVRLKMKRDNIPNG